MNKQAEISFGVAYFAAHFHLVACFPFMDSSRLLKDVQRVFELLNVIDDHREVSAENGVGGTDAEAGPLNISKGRCGVKQQTLLGE